jgi:formate dehydrogenase major subunit
MKVLLTIDGQEAYVKEGGSIKEAAASINIVIPGLCHLPGRRDAATPCLLCLVEANGMQVRACSTPAAAGMTVRTSTPAIEKERRKRLEELISFHYGDCKAPCNLTCPAGINVQGYVNYIARGEYGAALSLIREQNPLPGIVCRVCPRFCESRCRRVLIDEPIAINHLKRFAVEYGSDSASPVRAAAATGFKAAVVGGGPAGLSCAWYLRRFGHEVTLFEAAGQLGGMARYGIPAFKLPEEEINRDVENIINLGVHVLTGKRWGRDFSITDLLEQGFLAVFLATGIADQKKIELPGAEHLGDALDFLRGLRKGEMATTGKRTLVIGGGRIAVETARSALRAGANEVTLVYPRAKVEMAAHQRDIVEAEKEGVQFFMMAQPLQITREGDLIRVEMARTILSEAKNAAPDSR